MRIISGIYKGRKINGKVPPNVRPTQDALRETIFNIIGNYFDFEGKIIADLCCGTGALGMEALSRGAEFCHFVDISKQSLAFVKAATEEIKVPKGSYRTLNAKAELFFKKLDENSKIDVVFTDPPYFSDLINQIVFSAAESESFPSGSFLVAEYGAQTKLIIPDNIDLLSERHFTISKFALLEKK